MQRLFCLLVCGHPLSKRGVCFREFPGTLCQPHLKFLGGSLQLVFGLFQRSHVLLQYRASLEKLRASLLNSPLDLGDVISQRFFTLLVSGDLLAELTIRSCELRRFLLQPDHQVC